MKMRYCRVEFRGPKSSRESEQVIIPIEFGFIGSEQKRESIKRLRAQYRDYRLWKIVALKIE